MTRSRTRTRSQEVAGLSTLGTIARMTERSRPEGDLSARWAPLSALERRGGLSHAAREHRVRLRRCAAADPARDERGPGRGQDGHGVEPRRRLRPGRANGPLGGCRSAEARRARDVRSAQQSWPDDDVARRIVASTTVAHATEQANLRILTTGPLPPNPAELLGSHRMQAVLGLLQQERGPRHLRQPAAPGGDRRGRHELVRWTGRSSSSTRPGSAARRPVGRETLARAGAKTLGAVLNRVPARTQFGYGGYYGRQGVCRAERPACRCRADVVRSSRRHEAAPDSGARTRRPLT